MQNANNLYYIYIDNQIMGAYEQLLGYFDIGVFNTCDLIYIYVKYYKQIANKIARYFESRKIPYRFIKKHSDIELINGKIVFYLFNAQSNCRMVAFRNVHHVFVTHGESNKLASVKPIIRIYDYIIVSGQMGIDRYLHYKIFNKQDVLDNRIIKMGNTFTGKSLYQYSANSKTILYAPTWEGGVSNENYSSISPEVSEKLLALIRKFDINSLIIQPHPNLGHRDKTYLKKLDLMINFFYKRNIAIILKKTHFSWKEKFMFKRLYLEDGNKNNNILFAVVDVSAMEMQLISQNIPVLVATDLNIIRSLKLSEKMKNHYFSISIFNKDRAVIPNDMDYFLGFHDEELGNMSFYNRVRWLCNFVGGN